MHIECIYCCTSIQDELEKYRSNVISATRTLNLIYGTNQEVFYAPIFSSHFSQSVDPCMG